MSVDDANAALTPACRPHFAARVLACCLLMAEPLSANEGLPSFQHYDIAQGLSQVTAQLIAQDGAGFMWIGTGEGLNRFDGYRFEAWRHEHEGVELPNGDVVLALEPDGAGNLWVLTPAGVDFYDARRGRFEHLLFTDADRDIPLHLFTAFLPDRAGELWFGFRNRLSLYRVAEGRWLHLPPSAGPRKGAEFITNLIELPEGLLLVSTLAGPRLVDARRGRWIEQLPPWLEQGLPNAPVLVKSRAPDGALWLLTTDEQYRLDPARERIERESFESVGLHAKATAILEQRNGDTWVATTAGLFHRPAGEPRYRHYRHSPLDRDGLPGSYLTALHEDDAGNVWIGTHIGGLAKYSSAASAVRYFRNFEAVRREDSAIEHLAAARNGSLLISTLAGGLMTLEPRSQTLQPFAANLTTSHSTVTGIAADHQGGAWLATRDGLVRYGRDGSSREWRLEQPPGAPPANSWNDIQLGADGRLWLLSKFYGLYLLDNARKHLRAIPLPPDVARIERLALTRLLASASGELFLAGDRGELLGYDPRSDRWRRMRLPCAPARHLRIYHVHESPAAELLLSSNVGLIRRGIESERCEHLGRAAGLPGNTVNAALSDETGRIWLSTNHGISRYTPATGELVNFSASDGLHMGEFVTGGALRVGEFMYFGSENGVARIDPRNWNPVGQAPAVQLTGLSVNFDGAKPGTDNLLSRALLAEPSLVLPRDRNSLTIRFAATDFSASADYGYSYRLQGFGEQWIASRDLSATFTGLAPGQYQFEVRARRAPFDWGPTHRLPLAVTPAWWELPVARTAFVTLAVIALIVAWLARTWHLRQVNQRLERAVAERTHEIRALQDKRSRLFMNISHELRTPLTLVLGPLADLLREVQGPALRRRLSSIQRNAERLLRLVDAILLLARLHDGQARSLTRVPVALAPLLHAMLESYQILARRGGVELNAERIDEVNLVCEHDWPEIVFSNLISNAIKYTDPGGRVRVRLEREESGLVFTVADTGIGIAPEARAHIFEPFFRIRNETRRNELLEHSSGVGLAHVKEIIERLDGQIALETAPGQGTRFTVRLPIESRAANLDSETRETRTLDQAGAPGRPSLLIVEDCRELAEYLVQLFAADYDCAHVTSAEEAGPFAFEHLPDLVLADIRLPAASGLALAERLKTDLRTSHIPVILLTALPDHELRLQSLRCHVDDYLRKPFDGEELRLRVRNQLRRRQALREHFQREWLTARSAEPASPRGAVEGDNAFLRKLNARIEAQLDDPSLDVNALCTSLHLSAKQVQRKVRSLTDLTPTEYIRLYRLRKAAELLLRGEPISRAAYATGFSSQSYFTTCFKHWTGETPRRWQERRLKTTAANE